MVANVDPTLSVTPTSPTSINEGDTVTFDAMFSDPGFDNPDNPTTPATGDPKNESFTYDVDWGDGRDAITGMTVADMNGMPGDGLQRHVQRQPHLRRRRHLHGQSHDPRRQQRHPQPDVRRHGRQRRSDTRRDPPSPTTINEGDTVTFDAMFSDPGFDNPINPTTPATGEKNESFTYDVDWGDGRDAITGMTRRRHERHARHGLQRHVQRQPHLRRRRHLHGQGHDPRRQRRQSQCRCSTSWSTTSIRCSSVTPTSPTSINEGDTVTFDAKFSTPASITPTTRPRRPRATRRTNRSPTTSTGATAGMRSPA